MTERPIIPDWPAAMRVDTLRAYLDCRSDSDFARKLKELEARGYPGEDPLLHRHIRAVVDQYLTPEAATRAARKARMLEKARGGDQTEVRLPKAAA